MCVWDPGWEHSRNSETWVGEEEAMGPQGQYSIRLNRRTEKSP